MRAPLIAALFLLPVSLLADGDVPALMAQAQRAYLGGDYETAKELFGEVVEIDPQNTLAIQYLRNIRLAEAGKPPAPKADPIKSLILQKVDLKEATFSAALEFFRQKAADQSVTVSFVPELPAPQMAHTVTLSLAQIPFLDALHYLCQLNSADYKVEPYAIVITPLSADATPAPAPSSQ
jgi:hypothetical protein